MRIASTPELRHIVDVDGQLIGIDPCTVSTVMLRALAGFRGDLVQVLGELEMPLQSNQIVRLREDEVLFFRSTRRLGADEWRAAA